MTTVDKNGKTYGRTNQLQPSEILNRLMQGDEYNAAQDRTTKNFIARKHKLQPQDCHQRSKIATMFGANSGYNPHYVSRTPWRILDVLSVKSAPADIRHMLADLIFAAVKATNMGTQPSAASISPDVALIERIMDDPEQYRRQIEVMHAHKRSETEPENMSLSEIDLLREELPDIRTVVYGAKTAEEEAVEEAAEILARTPFVLIDQFNPTRIPEQKAFPADMAAAESMLKTLLDQALKGKLAEVQAELDTVRAARAAEDERKAAWHLQLIRTLESVSNIEDSADLLAETARTAADTISALIKESSE